MTGLKYLSNELTLIMHADWSTNPKKRVICCAQLQDDGAYRIGVPELADDITTLLKRVSGRIGSNDRALVGFDFPIGLPLRYAELSGIDDFLEILPRLGKGDWHEFYSVAETPDEISFRRPFYPRKPGGTRQEYLIRAIGVGHPDELRRACEKPTASRRAAAPLFWTLGPQQVGKAAICGWRDVLTPGLQDESLGLAIWPFHGNFETLPRDHSITVVETYPAEFYTHLGINLGRQRQGGKGSVSARAQCAQAIKKWAHDNRVKLDEALTTQIDNGFSSSFNDDGFDSFIGVAGMLNAILGNRSPGTPDSRIISKIEGWIFGQTFIV